MATAQLDVDSNKFNLPVVKASAGPDGIVVSKLRNDGWVTLDPGFLTTAQCESKITYIDGKHSILRYCGYPIEQLCENSDFLEVAWLLRHGELPSRAEYEQFCADINHKTMVGEDFRTFMGSFPRSAHPMCLPPPSMRWPRSTRTPPIFLTTTSLMRPPRSSWPRPVRLCRTSSAVVAMSRCCTPITRAAMWTTSCACASLCRTSRLNPTRCMCMLWVVC